MRLKIFHTPKPKRFSFHTRYYDPKKLSEETKVEKGVFANYRNRKGKFDTPDFEDDGSVVQKSSSFTFKLLIYFTLLAVAALSFFYFKYGWILSVSILAFILAFSKRK
ncbi:MAG: hypothetical protein KDE33_07680 [Bacteroidetes bacterium]|nr:hypothetical protein [Bacteroidota bacterium]MCB9225798.1 hypothetical protein [Chitinophagales bacterium]